MVVIHQEKTIERVTVASIKRTGCFQLPDTGDRVWMYVEHRLNANAHDTVFIIDMATGTTKEIPDTTLVEEVETALIVKR